MQSFDDLYRDVDAYYTRRVRRFGATPLGVDWSCEPTQELRFIKLLKLCDLDGPLSLNDVGCGYGALVGVLARRHPKAEIDYLGVDLSKAMVRKATKLWPLERVRFHHGHRSPRIADYSIASGIFNVMLTQPREEWERFVETSLCDMNSTSRLGFAVNFVSEPRGGQKVMAGLYCASAERWAEYCRREFGADVSLIDGYGMSEFTLLVRRSSSGRG